jgi:hypothetical protein
VNLQIENLQLLYNSGLGPCDPEHEFVDCTHLYFASLLRHTGHKAQAIETLRPAMKRCFEDCAQKPAMSYGAQLALAMILIALGEGAKVYELFARFLCGLGKFATKVYANIAGTKGIDSQSALCASSACAQIVWGAIAKTSFAVGTVTRYTPLLGSIDAGMTEEEMDWPIWGES